MRAWYKIKDIGNKTGEISIMDEIGGWGITAKEFTNDLKALGNVDTLNVIINSPGGSVSDGNAIYNALKKHDAAVNVSIEGAAYSMGSVIAMAGDTVGMAENAVMMVHDPLSGGYGNAAELRKLADVLDTFKAGLVSAYVKKTGKTADEISAIMSEETWFTAQDAVDAGFADTITDAVEVSASFDLSKFKNMPESILDRITAPISAKAEKNPVSGRESQERGDNMPNVNGKATDNTVDVKAIAAEAKANALKAEKKRCDDIRAVFGSFEAHSEIMTECLTDQSVSVDAASQKLLTALGADSEPIGGSHVIIGADVTDKFREGAAAALQIRAGMLKDDGANEFRGMTLGDMARCSLDIHNVSTKGMRRLDIVGAAFTHSSSDFPFLLENTIGKKLQAAYGVAAETWRDWCAVGSVPDFKVNSRIRMGSFNSLDVIEENGEYTNGSFGEEKETIQAQTKGKMISLSRQMIINDDLNGFMRVAALMGRAAARTVGNDAYAILTSNPTMNDGIAFFHANHNNLPTAAAPTVASVGAARSAMRLQKDPDNNDVLDIRPKYILGPVALEDTLSVLMRSETDPAQSNSRKPNAVRNAAQVITDPRLDTASSKTWYLIADQNEAPAVEVAFLDGVDTPYLESSQGFTVDGIRWKVRLDYGVSAIDWRGALKNAGV